MSDESNLFLEKLYLIWLIQDMVKEGLLCRTICKSFLSESDCCYGDSFESCKRYIPINC